MSNVASLELCKELYELSGWETDNVWIEYEEGEITPDGGPLEPWVGSKYTDSVYVHTQTPAYDLGYLLRKLPDHIMRKWNNGKNPAVRWDFFLEHDGDWDCGYRFDTGDWGTESIANYADTPEDAAAHLAIELFKQGILPTNKEKETL